MRLWLINSCDVKMNIKIYKKKTDSFLSVFLLNSGEIYAVLSIFRLKTGFC